MSDQTSSDGERQSPHHHSGGVSETDAHLFAWEKHIWFTALTLDQQLSPLARKVALDLVHSTDPEIFHNRGGLCVWGSMFDLARALHLGLKAAARVIEELRRKDVLSWSTKGFQFHSRYLDRQHERSRAR